MILLKKTLLYSWAILTRIPRNDVWRLQDIPSNDDDAKFRALPLKRSAVANSTFLFPQTHVWQHNNKPESRRRSLAEFIRKSVWIDLSTSYRLQMERFEWRISYGSFFYGFFRSLEFGRDGWIWVNTLNFFNYIFLIDRSNFSVIFGMFAKMII